MSMGDTQIHHIILCRMLGSECSGTGSILIPGINSQSSNTPLNPQITPCVQETLSSYAGCQCGHEFREQRRLVTQAHVK